MKTKTLLTSTLLTAALAITSLHLISSGAGSPQPGMTNEPVGNTNCTNCHTTNAAVSDASKFSVKIATTQSGLSSSPLSTSFQYTPGTTYWMSLTLNSAGSNAKRFGFEISCQDQSQQNAGRFIATNLTNTHDTLLTSGALSGHSYLSHYKATGNKTWIFKWQAPQTAQGPVTFYYAGNFADSSLTNQNDQIYYANQAISSAVNGVETVAAENFRVYPAHAHQVVHVETDASNGASIRIGITDMQGATVKSWPAETLTGQHYSTILEVGELPSGMYLVHAVVNGRTMTSRFVKN
ncbi:MAG: choice-of-anchor V domain-containing protein [Chitinophagales bacterium]